MDASEFVARWRKASHQNELAVYADHLDDLARLANHPTRLATDPDGAFFRIQKATKKVSGNPGAADGWYRGRFLIEYKGLGGDLEEAYVQLLQYRDTLDNPPLLITSDLNRIVIRTNYTGRTTRRLDLNLDNIASGELIADTGLNAVEIIRRCFYDPVSLVPETTTAKLTEDVATKFQGIAINLRDKWGHSDMAVARYLTKLVFCMFASDTELLPKNIISTLIDNYRNTSAGVAGALGRLFVAMNEGGDFGQQPIRHFNGGLFSEPVALEIDSDNLDALRSADQQNWADVEPSIFGTLFERVIDEKQRKALGKHYTSREDIELLIHPVIMWPLLREWGGENAIDQPLDAVPTRGLRREIEGSLSYNKYDRTRRAEAHAKLQGFIDRLGRATVLDPACGSGNFLYVALEKLVALEHEAVKLALAWELPPLVRKVHPRQLFGIEKNEYAHQLASTVVWIGYLQSKRKRGDYSVDDPVLEPLDNIKKKDAILDLSDPENPKEPEWPEAEFVVGNPPFLGSAFLRRELGARYVDALFEVYRDRLSRRSDLCGYWFAKALTAVRGGTRAGLIATQAIRGGANRRVLEDIKRSGDIFFAVDDREWVLNGAQVQVSMIGFDNGSEARRVLLEHEDTVDSSSDGKQRPRRISYTARVTEGINADLTVATNVASAIPLPENRGIAFQGVIAYGDFDVPRDQAAKMLDANDNPTGRSNREVMFPWLIAEDINEKPRGCWVIAFPPGTTEQDAATFVRPFGWLVERKVKEYRHARETQDVREYPWWLLWRPRPDLSAAVQGLSRFICVPRTSKHAAFVWREKPDLPSEAIVVLARADDYFFGVVNSRAHEVWSRRRGTQLREAKSGFRYSHTSTFLTYPMPWSPGREEIESAEYAAIAAAAQELESQRTKVLKNSGETLNSLYDRMKAGELAWLANAHERLDRAVFAAYGWDWPLDDQEILSRLLAENVRRGST